MKLKAKELCPIHRRRDCCGRRESFLARKKSSKWETVRPGVRRIRDEHARHPDGYRYRLSKSEMAKVVARKVTEQFGWCSICQCMLEDMRDVVPDHKEPRGMNGGWRDDRPENIGAAHSSCNLDKGSRRDLANETNALHENQTSDSGGRKVLDHSSGRESNSGLCGEGSDEGRNTTEG